MSYFYLFAFFRGLDDIVAIRGYIHLRFIDVSNNNLTDLSPLTSLPTLLWLKARNSHLPAFTKEHFCGYQYHSILSWVLNAALVL